MIRPESAAPAKEIIEARRQLLVAAADEMERVQKPTTRRPNNRCRSVVVDQSLDISNGNTPI
jgi:hypothetical protein